MFTTAPEFTTAISDFVLAIVATTLTLWLIIENSKRHNKKIYIIIFMLALLAFTSFYGTLLHGLNMDRKIWRIAWIPLAILLGCIPLLVLVEMTMIWKKENVSNKRIFLYVALQSLFSLIIVAIVVIIQKGMHFASFIAYSSSVTLTALVMSLIFTIKTKRLSSIFISIGIAIMLTATILQEVLKQLGFAFVMKWIFDYNSVYHFMMIIAIIVTTIGIKLYINEEEKICLCENKNK